MLSMGFSLLGPLSFYVTIRFFYLIVPFDLLSLSSHGLVEEDLIIRLDLERICLFTIFLVFDEGRNYIPTYQ